MNKSTTTVALDREVVREAKILAAEQRTTLKVLIETAMLAYFTRWPKQAPISKAHKVPM